MSKIILLNGGKLCGKNISVDRIKHLMFNTVEDRRCKDHLFEVTALLFKMTVEEFFVPYENRELKEVPLERFSISGSEFNRLLPFIGGGDRVFSRDMFGIESRVKLSSREALIYTSEVVCKPAFGQDYFGVARAESIGEDEFSIDDSCGFDDEIPPTISKLGMENVMLIRIRGRGSFDGDSRNFISDGVVDNTHDLWNTGTEEEFLSQIGELALKFYNS